MRVSEKTHFLTIESYFESEDIDFSLTITGKLPSLLREWNATTRISPVWPLFISSTNKINFNVPSDRQIQDIIFLSRADPGLFYEHIDRSSIGELHRGQLWLSLGMHNIIILSHDADITQEIEQFCLGQNIESERWIVSERNGRKYLVNDIRYIRPSDFRQPLYTPKTKTAKKAYAFPSIPTDDPMAFTIVELYALLSAIEGRSRANFPTLSEDCLEVERQISLLLPQLSDVVRRDVLLGLNAGLSRLASQAFSGTSPISRTECHFWPHSLLGIGIANVALRNVTDFIISCVRRSQFHQRYELIKGRSFDPTILPRDAAKHSAPYFSIDRETASAASLMDNLQIDVGEESSPAIFNPVTYYSGRDGFRNGAFTTSAPLMSVAGCNSVQWNLGTITHELSHRILSGKLEEIFEDILDEMSVRSISTMDDYYEATPSDIGQFCQRLLAMSLVVLFAQRFANSHDLDARLSDPIAFLTDAKESHSEEIEEMMVHMFDYYHFYGLDKTLYINFIWQSWAVQPSIVQKLDYYIKRTITALAVAHFRLADWKERAINDFESVLNSEPLKTTLPFYIEAKGILENPESRADIASYLQQISHIIIMFHFAFKSDTLRKLVAADPYRTPTTTSAKTKSGARYPVRHSYAATRLVFAGDTAKLVRPAFSNPLSFLRDLSTDPKPNAAKSAWLLHMLSFNILDERNEQ
ncbi:MAG: hypothetical protein M9939_02230 [Mesorhizobium sp.]|nr:hypothetical protein [Mesorhizobium sp.]MCO5159926.1 hypothetical protein [Mesorhizobium sp.]